MSADYAQHHSQRGYPQYEQRGYQQHDQRGYQPHDQRDYQQHDQRSYQQQDRRGYPQHEQRDYQDYDQQEYQSQMPTRQTILERGRAIRLMRNGDPFFTGRVFVINQKKYPMLDVFLDDASRSIHANYGAVRCIYTPRTGTKVKDISDFEDHHTYVAAGRERFKKLHYLDIAEGKRVSNKTVASPKLPPIRRIDTEGRALKLARSENVIIYVYRNGDPLTLPAKILLVKSTLQSWESVLDEITKKITLSNSAVLKLYSINGELITSAQQLEYNGMYIAAGKERFKRLDYPDPKLLTPNPSPKMSRKSIHPRMRLPSTQKKTDDINIRRHHQPVSTAMQHRYTKSDGTYTHTTTANSHGSNENPGYKKNAREDYEFFNNKPQQHRRGPVKETDLDRDEGGVYKGRVNHRDRAREIDDTRDTKVDIPINYREVETVEDENLYGNLGKNSRRQQPNNGNNYYNNENNRYGYQNNPYDNDSQHATPTRTDDDRHYRQPLTSSGTQRDYRSFDYHQ